MKAIIGGIVAMPFMATASHVRRVCYKGHHFSGAYARDSGVALGATGMRALDHAIETIYTKRHHPLSDALGAKAISLLVEHLRPSIETSTAERLAHRGECQLATWFSIFGSMGPMVQTDRFFPNFQ